MMSDKIIYIIDESYNGKLKTKMGENTCCSLRHKQKVNYVHANWKLTHKIQMLQKVHLATNGVGVCSDCQQYCIYGETPIDRAKTIIHVNNIVDAIEKDNPGLIQEVSDKRKHLLVDMATMAHVNQRPMPKLTECPDVILSEYTTGCAVELYDSGLSEDDDETDDDLPSMVFVTSSSDTNDMDDDKVQVIIT